MSFDDDVQPNSIDFINWAIVMDMGKACLLHFIISVDFIYIFKKQANYWIEIFLIKFEKVSFRGIY